MDIVINNVTGKEDAIKRKTKYKIINAIVATVVVFSFAFGLVSYNVAKSQNSETITSKTTETSYIPQAQCDYVLNTNTMKAHKPDCWYADKICDKNREEYHGTKEELQDVGYTPCKYCQAW